MLGAVFSHVKHAHHATSEIGAHIVVAIRRNLQIERQHNVGGFDVLALIAAQRVGHLVGGGGVDIFHHLVAKIHTRREAQVEILGKAQVGEHIHAEAR